MEKKQYNNYGYQFLLITIFLTNLTQLPDLIQIKMSQMLPALWLFVIILYYTKYTPSYIIKALIYIAFCFELMLVFEVFTGNKYVSASLTSPLIISCLMFIAGSYVGKDFLNKNEHYYAYYISSLILAYDIFYKYLLNYDWSNLQYVYTSKNSASQIILTAVIIGFLMIKPSKRLFTIFIYINNFALIVILLMLRSRATLVGLVVFFMIILFTKNDNRFLKCFVGIGSAIVIILLLTNDEFNSFLIDNILLHQRGGGSLDSVTSNRWSMYLEFPGLIKNNELCGLGRYFIECFYLSSWTQYGLILGTAIIGFSIYPLIWCIRNRDFYSNKYVLMFCVCISYLINGLFEAIAPLGPGVKCYYLWLMFGALKYQEFYNRDCISELEMSK